MKHLLLVLGLLACTVDVSAQSTASRPLTAPLSRELAYFSQEVLLGGGNNIAAHIAPLTSSNAGFGTTQLTQKLAGSPVAPMSPINFTNPTTQAQAVSLSSGWVTGQFPSFQTRMAAWLASKGLSAAVFNYTQEIMVSTVAGPRKRSIAFNATIDNRGRATYGNPKVVDPDPTVLEAIYIPFANAAGLPASWKFPEAGQIKWRVLNKRYEPLTGWTAVNVGGAYDELTSDGDPDRRLACLVDKRNGPGCPGTVDVRELLDAAGATFALVSYVRKVQPDYTTDAAGNQTAVVAISVNNRLKNCGGYSNWGTYGFTLAMMADQYLARPLSMNTSFDLVQQYSGRSISPTESYYKGVANSWLGGANPDNYIFNPDYRVTELWSRSNAQQMKGVVYVAPLVVEPGAPPIVFSGVIPTTITAFDDITMFSWNPGLYGTWKVGSYVAYNELTSYFDVADPQKVTAFTLNLSGLYNQDVLVNGVSVITPAYGVTPPRPFSGYFDARPYLKVGANTITLQTYFYNNQGNVYGELGLTVDLGCNPTPFNYYVPPPPPPAPDCTILQQSWNPAGDCYVPETPGGSG